MSITNNTTALQNILDTVNSLPEVGGGGAEIITGTISVSENAEVAELTGYVYYTDAEGFQYIYLIRLPGYSATISCVRGSILCYEDDIESSSGIATSESLGMMFHNRCVVVEEDGFNIVIKD